jgi:predicted nucleic acid-binding protein
MRAAPRSPSNSLRKGYFDSFELNLQGKSAENRCRLLLSEDLQTGFTWRGVTVVNPLREQKHPLFKAMTGE